MLLKNLMNDYLNENNNTHINNLFNISNKLMSPIEVKKTQWHLNENNTCLQKIYDFKNIKQKDHFILEILKYQREVEVDIEIICRGLNVTINIHAYYKEISDLETDTSKDIDKIKKDVFYYYAEK